MLYGGQRCLLQVQNNPYLFIHGPGLQLKVENGTLASVAEPKQTRPGREYGYGEEIMIEFDGGPFPVLTYVPIAWVEGQ
jgi:hypothetical protein